MKKGWIITLVLLGVVFLIQQSVVLSEKTTKTVLLAQYNDINHQCTSDERSDGWGRLYYSTDKQKNIDKCIKDKNNDEEWCCVCFETSNYFYSLISSICSQLISVLSGTPTPTNTPTVTPTPTNTPTPTPIPVNCVWSNWSTCSVPCGLGTQTRYIATPASNGGSQCTGPSTQNCYIIQHCPVNCVWEEYGPCSKECGEGIKSRSIRTPAAYGGASCTGSTTSTCINRLCSDLGTGGLSNPTTTGQVIILTNIDPTPTPKRLPTPTPEPEHFNVIDYYLQAFKQPTPTRIPSPTPKPTIFISNQTPTAVPTTAQSIPTPTLRPESIIPQSLASQSHSIGRTSFTLNTATISEIRIVPNIITKSTNDNEKPFLPQEQKLLAQNVAGAGGGIMVTLQQKTGSQFVTRQDELTVKRGNQFFSISNQTEAPSTQASQKNTNNSTNSTQIPAEKLEINANNVVAQSSMALSVDPLSGILIVETPGGPQKVSIMPDEALGIVLELKALNNGVPEPSILLVSESGNLMYRIAGMKMEKFLGLLPIAVQKQILVSADTGSIIKIELSLISRILSFFTF